MQIFSNLSQIDLKQDAAIHLALGSFDGLHLGHQALIAQMPLNQGPKTICGSLTFRPHPSKILRPFASTALIMPTSQQERHFRALNLDFLIRHPFDTAFSQTPALAFLARLKQSIPNLAGLYVGESFRFGRQREGDVTLIAQWGQVAGVALKAISLLKKEDGLISSSKIRNLIQAGHFREANALLGYAYYAQGKLEEDGGLFVKWEPELQPPEGLYNGFLPELGISIRLRYCQGKVLLDSSLEPLLQQMGLEVKIEFTSLCSLC